MPAIFLGVVAIALSPIWVRLSDLGPTAVAFWRLALAIPFLRLWLGVADEPRVLLDRGPRRSLLPLLAPGLFFAGDLLLWHKAIRLTSVANATFFPNMAPLLVSLVAWRWLGERFNATFALGLAAALAGVALMVRANAGAGRATLLGDMLALGTAFFYAGYILSVKQLRRRFGAATVMLAGALVGAVGLLIATLLGGEDLLPSSLTGWLILAGLAWFSHAGGQGLIAYALAHLPASFSSVSLLLQPVLSALFAWLLLNEGVSMLQAAGGVMVLAGIVLARRGSMG
ncbi:MAG: DMT family transporter [Caldilineae bacterium]|nr:MAG: DMT family transporter [Caldilineae bacterium]